jgi:hypothetical protein
VQVDLKGPCRSDVLVRPEEPAHVKLDFNVSATLLVPREHTALSIYSQFLYFVRIDGRAKLPIVKF